MKWDIPAKKAAFAVAAVGLSAVAAYLLTPNPTARGAITTGLAAVIAAAANIIKHIND